MEDAHNLKINANPKTFFALTGKFDRKEAMQVLIHAAASTLLAIRAMGGRIDDTRDLYGMMAQAVGLPSAKSFLLVRIVMVQLGWIEVLTSITTDGTKRTLSITPRGVNRAAHFGEFLRDAQPGEEEGLEGEDEDAPAV